MAYAPPKIDWFKDYPEIAVQIVKATIEEVIKERRIYPFKPINYKMY